MNRRIKHNFTLLELLAVMGIAIILTVMAAPAFQRMITGNSVDRAAERLKLSLEQAQAEAAAAQRHVAVILPHDTGKFGENLRKYCFGGSRLAYVDEAAAAGKYSFDAFAPTSLWREAVGGAALLKSSTANSPGALAGVYPKENKENSESDFSAGFSTITIESARSKAYFGKSGADQEDCAIVFNQYGEVEAAADFYLFVAKAETVGDKRRVKAKEQKNYRVLKVNRFSGKVEYAN